MKTQKQLEKGQILILFVFGLIGLLAFTALALDGGMVYADRRYDQSVADAAALAGARAAEAAIQDLLEENFACGSPIVINAMNAAEGAAIARANSNLPANDLFPDVFDDDVVSDHMGVEVECRLAEKDLKVKVYVASETRTSFAHMLFGRDRIRNEVISVVHLDPAKPLAEGNAIVSLNDGPCTGNDKGTIFDGGGGNSVSINIKKGGVHSNSCITRNGHFTVNVEKGNVVHHAPLPGGYQTNGSGTIIPAPTHTDNMITIDVSWNPACGEVRSMSDATTLGSAKVLQPGIYNGGISIQNGDWIFEEGLYCLNGDLKINGGNVTGGCTVDEYKNQSGGPTGNCNSGGVTFFIQPNSSNGKPGEVDIMGGAVVNLYAPLDSEAAPEIPGMLIYMPDHNPGTIKIVGTSESEFRGTILAPTGDIDIGGTNQTTAKYSVQVIGWNVTVGGNSTMNITYDASTAVVLPAAASQHE